MATRCFPGSVCLAGFQTSTVEIGGFLPYEGFLSDGQLSVSYISRVQVYENG